VHEHTKTLWQSVKGTLAQSG